MLTIYDRSGQGLRRQDTPTACAQAVWIDLLNPTKEEERFVEKEVGLAVPTREEMQEIEVSSRLYSENGAHFMTAIILYQIDTPEPLATPVTFILTETQLITVRYAEPRAISLFLGRAGKGDVTCDSPLAIMLGLLESIIDREADLVERIQAEVDKLATSIFGIKGGTATRSRRFDLILKMVGREGEITSKARESLHSIGRVLTYVANVSAQRKEDKRVRERIKTESRDVASLIDHVTYLNARITFLLEATLGSINIEQNQIIKLFSVVAVILMPPTLVASIYGMNFEAMPELKWHLGYPLALLLMVVSAIIPYAYFRRKGWL